MIETYAEPRAAATAAMALQEEVFAALVRLAVPQARAGDARRASNGAILVGNHIREHGLSIENLLRQVAGTAIDEPIAASWETADALRMRDKLRTLTEFLSGWLDDFSAVLPREQHAELFDQIAPGRMGLLSRARVLQRCLEAEVRRAEALAREADANLPKGRPNNLELDAPVLWLAEAWKIATGDYPAQARDNAEGGDKGAFAKWAMLALEKLRPEVYKEARKQKAPVSASLKRLTASSKPGDLGILPPRRK